MPADILVGAPFCVWLRHFTQNSTPTKMQLHSALAIEGMHLKNIDKKFVLWLDLLGFKQFLLDEERVKSEWPVIEDELNQMIEVSQKQAKTIGFDLATNVISDTVISNITPASNSALTLLCLVSCEMQAYFMRKGFLSRGVISLGEIYSSKYSRISSFIGFPIVEAATLEAELTSPVIITAPSVLNYILENKDAIWKEELTSGTGDAVLHLNEMVYPIEADFKTLDKSEVFFVAQIEYYIDNLEKYLKGIISKKGNPPSVGELTAIANKLSAAQQILAYVLKDNPDFKTDILGLLDVFVENVKRINKS